MDPLNESLIPGLPDGIGIFCLAKLSLSCRLYISQVCRSWRKVFREKYFWDVRRKHAICETLLLVWSPNQHKNGSWYGFYTAARKWFRLPLVPSRSVGFVVWTPPTFAVVDEKLFVIGGEFMRESEDRSSIITSMVSYFDFKLYEWKEAASMNVARKECVAGVINNHLYVCCGFCGAKNDEDYEEELLTAEVYSPATNKWTFVSSMKFDLAVASGIAVDGKLYVVKNPANYLSEDWTGLVYDPEENEWTAIPEELNRGWTDDPVELDGQICVKRDHGGYGNGPKRISVVAYNLKHKSWKVIYGEGCAFLADNTVLRHRELWCTQLKYPGQLLALDGKLRLIDRSSYVQGLENAIRIWLTDLAGNETDSKCFHGTEDRRRMGGPGGELDGDKVEFQIARL